MRLHLLSFAEHEGKPNEWRFSDLYLGPTNLLVGRNASGKSRVLNVINALSRLLCGELKVSRLLSGKFDATFQHEGRTISYALKYENSEVQYEHFGIDGQTLLERGSGGSGRIFASKLNGFMEFQAPQDELAAVTRRDSIQHSFFEQLHNWASSLYHYAFGSSFGKEKFAVFVNGEGKTLNPRNTQELLPIFRQGEEKFGRQFKDAITSDMAAIGYDIEDVGLSHPTSIVIQGPLADEVLALYVKERDLASTTDQHDMSQGMYRALSVVVHVNYSVMAGTPSCFAIDDIGEGLDFERSTALINLLLEKAKASSVQVIMSTNDRFVMNAVPLESWAILKRTGSEVRFYNYQNSKEVFEEFRFTGLNNFDFFATDYLREAQRANEEAGDLR